MHDSQELKGQQQPETPFLLNAGQSQDDVSLAGWSDYSRLRALCSQYQVLIYLQQLLAGLYSS